MTRIPLFRGPASLRVTNENMALGGSIFVIGILIPLLSALSDTLSWHSLALIAVVGMVFVTLSRGRLLGTSVRVHAEQFPEVFAVVERCATMLDVAMPHIFIRDDDAVPIAAVGIGEPYSLVISARWLHELKPDELAFVVGRELGHIAAGHTRFTSLLSINGKENPLVAVAFGVWLRKLEYTADRIGLLVCGHIDAAHRAVAITTFHALGRAVDLPQFAEQRNELQREPSLRMGEWLTAMPYAVHRISALDAFANAPLAAHWRAELTKGIPVRNEMLQAPDAAEDAELRRDGYAGFWRRVSAFAIDAGLCGALVPQITAIVHRAQETIVVSLSDSAPATAVAQKGLHFDVIPAIAIAIYVVILVAWIGQTFGMLVLDLRVVDARLRPVGIVRTLARYGCLFASLLALYPLVRIFGRIQPFERWSGTRIVQTRALEERRTIACTTLAS